MKTTIAVCLCLCSCLTACGRAVNAVDGFVALFGDSPTAFTQAGPVQIASNEESVIFKSPTESNTCGLGGVIAFVAQKTEPPLTSLVRFAYVHADTHGGDDVLSLGTEASALEISSRGQYRFNTPPAGASWERLPASSVTHRDRSGIAFSIARQRTGDYRVQAFLSSGGQQRGVFSGTVLPANGIVYVRRAFLSSPTISYAGASQHNCGNWNTPDTATSALGRVEAHWPQ